MFIVCLPIRIMPLQLMVLQWKICETVFKVGLTTVFFYTVVKLPFFWAIMEVEVTGRKMPLYEIVAHYSTAWFCVWYKKLLNLKVCIAVLSAIEITEENKHHLDRFPNLLLIMNRGIYHKANSIFQLIIDRSSYVENYVDA